MTDLTWVAEKLPNTARRAHGIKPAAVASRRAAAGWDKEADARQLLRPCSAYYAEVKKVNGV